MSWIIASIPFWILGAFFLLGAIVAIPGRGPEETTYDLAGQVFFGLLASGFFFIVGAWIVS